MSANPSLIQSNNEDLSAQIAAAELLRRRRARTSLLHYSHAIEIPGAPISEDPDEALFQPVETSTAIHHAVMMDAIQRTMETPYGRLMIFAPPGAAKSSYCSVVAPTWAMGRWPGTRIILASYAADIARKQSRRARQIIKSDLYQSIWESRPKLSDETQAVDAWAMNNRSEYMAAGILAGITGNRASGVIIDDALAGREEADSITIRNKTDIAIREDAFTRLMPGAWIIWINTRWHEDDPIGRRLPEDYDGRSGMIACRDGQTWEVINIPAKAERVDDPIGRKVGEYLWPQWFDAKHWAMFEGDPRGQRTWSALYQQRPAPDSGTQFKREWFKWYDEIDLPPRMRYYGASDYALTEDEENDFTEHGVCGMDEVGDLWFVDWAGDQVEPDEGVNLFITLVSQWKPIQWWNEGGVIDKAVKPLINRVMREKQTFTAIEPLPSIQDKVAKASSFRGRASAGTIHFPRGKVWAQKLVEQLCAFPAGRFDDMVDVCGLIGRGIDQMAAARKAPDSAKPAVKPFSVAWLESKDDDKPKVRYR